MKCAGSSMTSTGTSRKFIVDIPIIDGFYSGTGDLFAALTLARLREYSDLAGLLGTKSWAPSDETTALDLPLTKAIEVVLGSMHMVLEKTRETRDRVMKREEETERDRVMKREEETERDRVVKEEEAKELKKHVAYTRASELRLVQCQKELLTPVMVFKAVVLA